MGPLSMRHHSTRSSARCHSLPTPLALSCIAADISCGLFIGVHARMCKHPYHVGGCNIFALLYQMLLRDYQNTPIFPKPVAPPAFHCFSVVVHLSLLNALV